MEIMSLETAGGPHRNNRPKISARREKEKTRAEKNIAWVEKYLFVPDGKFVGRPLKMADFMKKDFKAIFDNPHGTRRAIISRARKNGKTIEAAIILLLFLVGREAKKNAQLFSAAQSRDQAALIWNLAVKMIRQNPKLNGAVVVRDTAKQLLCPALGTTYRALSAESTTAWGLSPSLVLHDELSQVRGPHSQMFEALETATASQESPLTIIISTQSAADVDLLSALIDEAATGHDPRTVLRLDTAPLDLDPFSLEAIKAANPAFDVFMNQEEVLSMAENARRMVARQSSWENLCLNRRVEASNPFVSTAVWKKCAGEVKDLKGIPVYAGLDLSSVADLTALVLIGKYEKTWHVKPTCWLPTEGLREKSQKDRVPYDLWAKQGFLETTPGNSISYEYVAAYLKKVFDQYDIRKLAFDRWNFKYLQPWLIQAGFSEMMIKEKFVEYGQGSQSMSPPLRDLEQVLVEGQLAHGGHPVLAMCATCAVVEGKDSANRKLSKNKSSGRIDAMVALVMAFGVAPMGKVIDVRALIG